MHFLSAYVVAADAYGVAPHIGRGGWTWYTGSAGWMLTSCVFTPNRLAIGTRTTYAPFGQQQY